MEDLHVHVIPSLEMRLASLQYLYRFVSYPHAHTKWNAIVSMATHSLCMEDLHVIPSLEMRLASLQYLFQDVCLGL